MCLAHLGLPNIGSGGSTKHTVSESARGGGGGFEKTFFWKTFEFQVTSCQYLFQARSKFFKTLGFVPLCFFTTFSFSQVHHQIDQNVKCIIIMRIEAI